MATYHWDDPGIDASKEALQEQHRRYRRGRHRAIVPVMPRHRGAAG